MGGDSAVQPQTVWAGSGGGGRQRLLNTLPRQSFTVIFKDSPV